MPTGQQDRAFSEVINANVTTSSEVSSAALDEAIAWISSNLDPDDVFSKSDLEAWAENNGYTKE